MKLSTPVSEDIKKSFDFMRTHLGNIENDLTIIGDEIKEIKEKLWLTDMDRQEFLEKYEGLTDTCKKALVGLAAVMGIMEGPKNP